MLTAVFLFIFLGLNADVVRSHDNGAPDDACGSMMPGHGSYVPQSGPSPFQLEVTPTSAPSDPSDPSSPSIFCLNVTLSSRYENVPFKGFFIQGRTSADLQSSKTMGGFLPQEDNNHVQLINCPGRISSGATHVINDPKRSVSVLWVPPFGFSGLAFFSATVVKEFDTFWVGLESNPARI